MAIAIEDGGLVCGALRVTRENLFWTATPLFLGKWPGMREWLPKTISIQYINDIL